MKNILSILILIITLSSFTFANDVQVAETDSVVVELLIFDKEEKSVIDTFLLQEHKTPERIKRALEDTPVKNTEKLNETDTVKAQTRVVVRSSTGEIKFIKEVENFYMDEYKVHRLQSQR